MIDVSSILWFLGLYLLLNVAQILVTSMCNLADLIVALIVAKVNQISENINSDDESKEGTNCIGFQIPSAIEEEDEDDWL